MGTYLSLGKKTKLLMKDELAYIEFDSLSTYKENLIHAMSTRLGGTSVGECSSLNLGYNRNDKPENVKRNLELFCDAIDIPYDSMVFSKQVHGCRIRDIRAGFNSSEADRECDGLITAGPGITIVTFYADCVPVFLYDPQKQVTALLHSGWRSTLLNISKKAVNKMEDEYFCRPESIIAVIGPSIRKCCFEVNKDVYEKFKHEYDTDRYYYSKPQEKWNIDLQGIIFHELLIAGLTVENITDCELCTVCRKDLFFSYRGDNMKTGSLAAFMMLKP